MSKQFYFKQFSLAWVHNLSFIWSIDRTLSGATTPVRVELGAMAINGYSAFPKLQHYWSLTIKFFSVISRTLVGRGFTPVQRFSRCIRWVSLSPLQRCSRGLSRLQRCSRCILELQPTGLLLGYPSAEMQSVYSTVPADWATGHWLGESYSSAKMQSVYSIAPANWATRWESLNPLQRWTRCILQPQPTRPQDTPLWSLTLCRDAVGVF